MRISDWSSDVCSSDLNKLIKGNRDARRNNVTLSVYELGSTFKPISIAAAMDAGVVTSMSKRYDATQPLAIAGFHIRDDHPMKRWLNVPETLVHSSNIATARIADEMGTGPRSEEHTSELQSLMRISYAVFCLKKK